MKRTSKRPTRSAVKFTPAGWPERLARQVALVACPPVLRGERRHPEPVREFESEIHKFLSLNNLRVLSLIKVDSLLARTYVGERRILGQAPSWFAPVGLQRHFPKLDAVNVWIESVV